MVLSLAKLKKDPKAYAESLTKTDLLKLLKKLDKDYHVDFKPRISDHDYEEVKDVFRDKYPRHTYLKETGHRVGNKKEEILLPAPMPSLNKAKIGTKQLVKYIEDYEGPSCLMDKLDGISGSIIYENGKPVEAYSRGNGIKGKDLSRHIPNMRIPKRIPYKGRLNVRVEFLIKSKTFAKKYDKEVGGDYTAERNFAGGILNDNKPNAKVKDLLVVCYRILEGKFNNAKMSKQLKMLEQLKFTVVDFKVVKRLSQPLLSKYYALRTKESPYELDGIVMAHEGPYPPPKGMPKHSKAYKENSEADMVLVTCTGVDWNESRTGRWVPRVTYKPTKVGGVVNSKATAHNAFFIQNGFSQKDKKLGLPVKPVGKGATLKVVRSGKVIPYIVEVVKGAKQPDMPPRSYTMKGADAIVKGKSAKTDAKQVTHFFTSIGVDGLKLTTVNKLIDNGYNTIEKIIGMNVEDYVSIEGLGRNKGKQFVLGIKNSLMSLDFITIAYASNIFPTFGRSTFEKIYEAYPDILKMWKRGPDKLEAMLSDLPSFAAITSKKFAQGLPLLVAFIKKHNLKIKKPKVTIATGSEMEEHRITLTGGKPKDIVSFIQDQGGKIQSFKNDTTILVKKDDDYTSSKLDKAEDKDIPVMTQDEFRKKFKI